jgi:integrase
MASIRKRPDGAWRARYRDEAGKEHARHFSRKVDAQHWLDEVTTSIVTGQYVDPQAGKVTFADYYADWSARQVWVKGTERAMNLAAGSVGFGKVPLRAIRRSHLEQWVKSEESRGLAPGTINTRFNNVRAVFRAAVRDRLIASDPSEGVTLPRLRRSEAALTLPTTEQVGALMKASDKAFKPMLALAAFAGLRVGEVCGLQLGDIEFLARRVQVRRQVQRERGATVEVRAPKYGSERTVNVPEALTRIVSAHVAELGITEPGAWLFPGEKGYPAHQNTVTYHWGQARTKASVVGVKMHDMRHFFASGLIAAGCDVVTVQRALGHAKATTTLNTYAHLWPTAEDRTRAAAGRLMLEALGESADSVRTSDGREVR